MVCYTSSLQLSIYGVEYYLIRVARVLMPLISSYFRFQGFAFCHLNPAEQFEFPFELALGL